ncbi:MAG: tetratricopeptide repeat protein [Deltaproteobacteria bacterium]|nr:tetratricopeptide repeat protein [Deltaproteobacteria bacterium]
MKIAFLVFATMEAMTPQPNRAFLDALSQAEEVRIREVPLSKRNKLVFSLQEILRDFDGQYHTDTHRAYLVRLKVKPSLPNEAPLEKVSEDEWSHYADLLIENGDYLLARNIFSYQLQRDLRDPRALKGLGTCLFKLSDKAAAKKCFKALWELHRQPAALCWLGFCALAEHDDEQALEYFNQAAHGEPKHLTDNERFELYKELGNCFARMEEFSKAIDEYEKAAAINPSSDTLFVNRGTVELHRNNLASAAEFFKKAAELNPKNSKAICGLGLVAMTGENLDCAETEFERALDIDICNTPALFQLVSISHVKGDFTRVKRRLRAFLLNEPKNVQGRYLLGAILFKEGAWKESEKEVDAVLALQVNHIEANRLKEQLVLNKHRS